VWTHADTFILDLIGRRVGSLALAGMYAAVPVHALSGPAPVDAGTALTAALT